MGAAPILALALLCGCSHFDQEWQAAGARPQTGIEGRWQGKWVSEVDGHSGAIRCAIRRNGPNTYLASFDGSFWKVFRFSYDAPLHGQTFQGQAELAGEQFLGPPEGTVRYVGHAGNDLFFLSYYAQFDGGYFIMRRP